MSTIKTRGRDGATPLHRPALDELDRVKLVKGVTDKGMALRAGMKGTVVLCHGAEAYEVEFDGIDDFFQISARDLEKIP